MTRTSRARSRIIRGSFSGTVTRSAPYSVVTQWSPDLGIESCNDYVGTPWTDTPLSISRGVAPRMTLSGYRSYLGVSYTSVGVPLNSTPTYYMRNPYDYGPFIRAPIGGSTLAAMAVANANPNRPDVDLPVAIAELKELPSLLKDSMSIIGGFAGNAAKGSAKANLIAQFGIMPLVSDLGKLFQFADLVAQREQYLRELAAGGKRIKRKLHVETWVGSVNNLAAFHAWSDNSTSTNKVNISGKMKRTYWFTMRASLLTSPSEREIRSLAPQLVLGVHNLSVKQIWDLVPWSWLIDWFTTTGILLAAYRGGLPWQYSGLNIMYQTEYDMTAVYPNPRAGFTYSPKAPRSMVVTKNRIQPGVSIYPTWRIPYLTGAQWSILSSLAILRTKF